VESSLNPRATRFEPKYKYLFEARKFAELLNIPEEEESAAQMTSWGLMQVMGGVCREYGYSALIPALQEDAELALTYSARHLKNKIHKYGTLEGIVSYNSGSPRKEKTGMYSNQHYLDKVNRELMALNSNLVSAR
jgi:hypothetical protein